MPFKAITTKLNMCVREFVGKTKKNVKELRNNMRNKVEM